MEIPIACPIICLFLNCKKSLANNRWIRASQWGHFDLLEARQTQEMGAPEEIFLFTEGERLRQKERRGGKVRGSVWERERRGWGVGERLRPVQKYSNHSNLIEEFLWRSQPKTLHFFFFVQDDKNVTNIGWKTCRFLFFPVSVSLITALGVTNKNQV